MATASTNISTQTSSLVTAIAWFANAILSLFDGIIEANSRAADIERLSAKSDQELQDMGLKRQDIVRHVFRDKMV